MAKGNNSGRGAMNPQAASRIQGAGARNSYSSTAQSGFGPRAQIAAAQNATGQSNAGQAGKSAGK